jgi:succinate dehydrogenase / fumarate reductase iron-sulfur subunit
MSSKTIKASIFRYNPKVDEKPCFDEFEIPLLKNMAALDVLFYIQNYVDKTLAFRCSCRIGMCGSCGMYINGHPHGPVPAITTCHLSMRYFNDGDTIWIEPWRAKAFPVIKDLIVDRSAFDKIQQAEGFISVNAGAAPEANSILVPKKKADEAFDAAVCIACGACVAACKNASAMLYVSAKISQFSKFPQGRIEMKERVRAMVNAQDDAGFGNCSNTGACEAECPKQITLVNIARLYREYYKSY